MSDLIVLMMFLVFQNLVIAIYQIDNCSIQEQLKQNFLNNLKIQKIPQFSKEEFEKFQIPVHMQMRYNLLAWKNKVKFQAESTNRSRRSSMPSLAGLFNEVHENSSVHGSFVYSSTFREKLRFDMEGKIPQRTSITIAQLRLFKKLPNFNRLNPKTYRSRLAPYTNRHSETATTNWRPSPIKHARVSVYHTLLQADGTEKSNLIDSRMIMVNGSGWQSFDVTKAVKQWQKHPVKYMSITLELRIEGSRPGRKAAEIARMVRFTGQKVASESPRKPELVVFTEEEETTRTNDCQRSRKSNQKCCRDRHYVDFRRMDWTQHWIVEPKGYEAYKCGGRCSASRRKTSPGVPRFCNVAQTSPLTIMYLVKRGKSTHVEISEFPNMVVEKCGCSLDSLYVV